MYHISHDDKRRIARISRDLRQRGRLDHTKAFIQHGHTTVYTHVHHVARIALWLNGKLKLKADKDRVIRSALLHDYFLYDWHDKSHDHPRPHGFLHPKVAMEKAHADYGLHEREKDAIRTHMFPLTPPPKHREGWLVTMADKLSTFHELRRYAREKKLKRRLEKNARRAQKAPAGQMLET